MAPNNVVKPAFLCKSTLEPAEKKCHDRNSIRTIEIRTDFILQNILSHLIKPVSNFQAIKAINDKEEKLLNELIEIVESFKQNYGYVIQGLCLDIEVTLDSLSTLMHGVSNELFSDGITWSRIVALFAFVGEYTLMCLSNDLAPNIVDVIYECFCRMVKEKLTGWIEDHGGWDGIRCLSKAQENITENGKSSNKGWAKSFLHGTVRMIGTLASFANTTGHGYP